MALGTPQGVTVGGVTPNPQTPSATENITGGRDLILRIANTGGGAATVTLVDPGVTSAGSAATNPTVTVPATTGVKVVFLPAALTSPSTGNIQVTFSGGTLLGELYYA